MTIPARGRRVFALQRPTSARVRKRFLSSFPVDQLEILAVVFVVAEVAIPVLCASVQAFTRLDPLPEQGVTVKAVVLHRLLTQVMAARAVLDSFEVRMGTAQLARGKLCRNHVGQTHDNQQDHHDPNHRRYTFVLSHQNTHR